MSIKINIDNASVDLTKEKMLEDFKKYMAQPLLEKRDARVDRIDDNYDLDSIERYNSDDETINKYKTLYKEVLKDIEDTKLIEFIKDKQLDERFEFVKELKPISEIKVNELTSSYIRRLLGDVSETQDAEIALKKGVKDYKKYFDELYQEPVITNTEKNEKEKKIIMDETTRFSELDKYKTLIDIGFVDISISQQNVENPSSEGRIDERGGAQVKGAGKDLFRQNVIPITRGKNPRQMGVTSQVDPIIYRFGIDYEQSEKKGGNPEDVKKYSALLASIRSINQSVTVEGKTTESVRELYENGMEEEIEKLLEEDRKLVNDFEKEYNIEVEPIPDNEEVKDEAAKIRSGEIVFLDKDDDDYDEDDKGQRYLLKPKKGQIKDFNVNLRKVKRLQKKLLSMKQIYKKAASKTITKELADRLKQIRDSINKNAEVKKNAGLNIIFGFDAFGSDEAIEGLNYGAFKEESQMNKPPQINKIPENVVKDKTEKTVFADNVKDFFKPFLQRKAEYIENREKETFETLNPYKDKELAEEAYNNPKKFLEKQLTSYINDLTKAYKFTLRVREKTLQDGEKKYSIERLQAFPKNINFQGGGRFTYGGKTITNISRADVNALEINTVVLTIMKRLRNLREGLN